jgi:hypothetical protein
LERASVMTKILLGAERPGPTSTTDPRGWMMAQQFAVEE